ncbi:MAG: Gfo/Idh/MocA family oxidoreductase [Nitrospinae bacterium]|nr:Gfo/Idh/MocA family oxidoreductase [Nitrospinota bacterium]
MSSPKTIRVGIIGGGRWAQYSHLPALMKLENTVLHSLASRNIEAAKNVAEKFGIKNICTDWWEIVNSKDIDAVIVLSPPKTHYPVVKAALEEGKHVLCEGPLAMNSSDAEEMLRLAESKKLVHGYTRPKLYIDGCKKVKELINDGTLGKINSARLDWRPTVWLDESTPLCWRHLIEESPPLLAVVPIIMMIDLFGEVESVKSESAILVKERYCPVNKKNTQVTAPDFFHGLFGFKSGLRVTVQAGAGNNALDENGLYIAGSNASIKWLWTLPNKILISQNGSQESTEVPYEAHFKEEWVFDKDFIEAIQNNTLPQYNFSQALLEMKAIDRISL